VTPWQPWLPRSLPFVARSHLLVGRVFAPPLL